MTERSDSEQFAEMETRLRAREQELRAEIRAELLRSDEQHFIDLAGQVHDSGDESVADMLADVDTKVIDQQIGEIREIEAALQRIAMGQYGTCVDCGEQISRARLLVAPQALRCVACQERHDRTHRATSGSSL